MDREIVSGCYLLHFDGNGLGRYRHYLGFSRDIGKRVGYHKIGLGAKYTKKFYDAGAMMTLVRAWPNATMKDERALKLLCPKNSCPICNTSIDVSTLSVIPEVLHVERYECTKTKQSLPHQLDESNRNGITV